MYGGGSKSGAFVNDLLTNPMYTKVVENNVHFNKSFGDMKMNIVKVLKEPRAAIILRHSLISNLKEYECKVNNYWKKWGPVLKETRKSTPL